MKNVIAKDKLKSLEIYDYEELKKWWMQKLGDYIMIKTFSLTTGQKPKKEQLLEVEEAKKFSIIFDEDSPELSPAMYKAFKCNVAQRNRKKNA